MNSMSNSRRIRRTLHQSTRHFAIGVLTLTLGLLLGAGNSRAATSYTWTNTTAGTDYWQDANAWSPVGVPGASDTATFAFSGTLDVIVTNSVLNVANFNFGSSAAAASLAVLTLDLGTNAVTGTSGDTTSASNFVIGQSSGGGTTIVYVAGSPLPGGLLCTNAGGTPRMIIGRNAPGQLWITNGAAVSGNTIFGNAAGANGSKLVVSGTSYFTNSGTFSVGNSGGVGGHSIVICNGASMTLMQNFALSAQSSSYNSFLVDSNGTLFTKNIAGAKVGAIGVTSSSSNDTMTVQNGSIWDNGNGGIAIGAIAANQANNALIVGNNGVVSNATFVNIGTASSLIISGGVLSISAGVTNNSGTVQGYGTINGNTFFTGTGTLTPGFGTSVGTLAISNSVTLVSGSTTVIKLDKAQAGSNDLLNVFGTLSEAGALTVNNVGAALVGGDTFKIFAFGSESGDFGTTNLPSLSGTLIWDTSQLGPQGTISVILPASITGPDNQAVLTNTDVTISTVATGVPAPSLQWQLGGVNLTDGATGNGSTISGSTSEALTILNAQVADSGQYCLIANNSGGAVTNCMMLTVAESNAVCTVGGPTDQYVLLGNDAVFSASVAGIPTCDLQWQENGVDILGATEPSITVPNVQLAQDGYIYSIIASNSEGSATNSATLHVIVPIAITGQPQSLVVTQSQAASFTVTATGTNPNYQWKKNNVSINNATNDTYMIASAQPSDMGNYSVYVYNVDSSATSSNASLTVNSVMTPSVTPSNGVSGVCYDTPLYMAFDRPVVLNNSGKIQIFNVTSTNPVDTLDMSLNDANGAQPRTIANDTSYSYNVFPVIITGTTAAIYPHAGAMTSNQTYYVTVDPGTFAETNGALFAGVTDTNAWRFTTKSAPSNPNNVVVAADGSGDFCTVQGVLDSLPTGNTTPTLANIHNGTYTELIDTRYKNNVTFRGQDRYQTIIKYANNSALNGSTHNRIVIKVFSNDIVFDNLTVTNSTVSHSAQAECFMLEANIKHFILNNAEAHSYLDTIDSNTGGTQGYINNCLIRGDQDVIWGNGNLFINNSEIRTLAANGSSTQARTDNPGSGSNGMSFVHCRITEDSGSVTNCLLGRSLGNNDGNVVYSYCNFGTNLIGWTDGATSRYWEYANSNLDGTAAAPVWAPANQPTEYLTNGDSRLACALNPSCWLNGWNPSLAPNILSSPTNLTVNSGQPAAFSVTATGIPDPTYQWLHVGTNLVGATAATLSIASAVPDDAGVYSVIVSTTGGSVTNSATLTVIPTAFESWQLAHFGCTICPQALPTADPDGDGQDNEAEYLAGTDPMSSASALRITSAARAGDNVAITWTTSGGHTNVVQVTAGDGNGNFATNDFADIAGSTAIIPGSGDATNNYTDVGGATNAPSRFYRIRLVP